jgi:Cytochrome P460
MITKPDLLPKQRVQKSPWLILILSIIGLVVPLILASLNNNTPQNSEIITDFPEFSNVSYPAGYRTDFLHYATVQRPDGTIRDLYVNDIGARAAQTGEMAPGTIIVIEGYEALTTENGEYITDDQGHYIKGEAMPMVHVREKRSDWSNNDFVSNARNGRWNSGSFELQTGNLFKESLTACFHCHSTAPDDFLYSFPQLYAYAQTGELQYFLCRTTGRTACEG